MVGCNGAKREPRYSCIRRMPNDSRLRFNESLAVHLGSLVRRAGDLVAAGGGSFASSWPLHRHFSCGGSIVWPNLWPHTRIVFAYRRRRSMMSMALLGNPYGNSTHPEVQISHCKIHGAGILGTAGVCAPSYTDGSRWPQAL